MKSQEKSKVNGEEEMSVADESDLGDGPVTDNADAKEESSQISEKLYQADALHLRNLLPEEIWIMITDFLRDSPDDLLNCVNASPYFRELQSDQKVIFLFPAVFGILVSQFEPRAWFQVDATEDEELKPGVVQGQVDMDKENDFIGTMRNCRLVCTSWNTAIENHYAKPEMNGLREIMDDPRSPVNLLDFYFSWTKTYKCFHMMEIVENFIQQFGSSHYSEEKGLLKNPMFGRNMYFETSMDATDTARTLQSLNAVSKLLKMFGKGVWYVSINTPSWHLTEDEYYLRIREWLCFMPNLKYLQLEQIWSDGVVSPAVLSANPMPKLENILVVDINYRSGGTIINEVVRANSHVPHLKFWESELDEEIGSLLSNLSVFSAGFVYSSFLDSMMEKYGPSWKLNAASVHISRGDFKGMLQLLENNWSDTLTQLKLSFPGSSDSTILQASKSMRLNLPHLRRLHVYVDAFILLDFILPLANTLEYLEIETWDPKDSRWGSREKRDAEGKDQTIQYAGFEKKLHQSNIWQIFKKLKTIKVSWIAKFGRFAVYTRDGVKQVYAHRNN